MLLLSFITAALTYSIRFGYGVISPKMRESLLLTDTQLGLIFGSYFIGYTLFSPVVGYLTDRFGGRRVISIFSIFTGLGSLIAGISSHWWISALAFGLAGLGSAAGWTGVVALVSNWFRGEKKGPALGVLMLATIIGLGVLGITMPLLLQVASWRFAWQTLGLLTIITAGLDIMLLRDRPPTAPSNTGHGSEHAGSQFHCTRPKMVFTLPFWLIGVSYLFMAFGTYVPLTFIVRYFYGELAMNYASASALASVFAFSGVFGSLILPFLSNRLGRKKSLVMYNAAMGVCMLMLALFARVFVISVLSSAAAGFLYGGIVPAYAGLASDYFSIELAGTALGSWTIYYGVGGILSPIVSGIIKDTTNSFVGAFVLAAIVCWLAALMARLAAPPHGTFYGTEPAVHF
jgi:MFS family permease